MTPLETSLQQAGLELTGTGVKLSALGPHWLHDSPLLEDFTLEEADIVGAGMLGARARSGQVLVGEGTVGDWMLLVLSGTVDVTRRVGSGRRGRAPGGHPRWRGGGRDVDARRRAPLRQLHRHRRGRDRRADAPGVARLIRDHPAVGAKLLVKITQLLAQRLRNTTKQLTHLLDRHSGRMGAGRRRAHRHRDEARGERVNLIRGKQGNLAKRLALTRLTMKTTI